MCETCGCSLRPHKSMPLPATVHLKPRGQESLPRGVESHQVLHNLMASNDRQAQQNRQQLNDAGVVAINLMSSPGSGKTRLLEATIRQLKKRRKLAVIEGDLETENDADRIRQQGVTAIQITTGTACHLDAHYIRDALSQLSLNEIDILFIENVGNLVCPAAFDLGQHANIVLLSTTEGDDKPLKYPVMFQKVDGMVVSKVELLEFFDDFSIDSAIKNFSKLANRNPVWPLSAKTGAGMESWLNWLIDFSAPSQSVARRELVT